MGSAFEESNVFLDGVHEGILPHTPPWIIGGPEVNFELNELPKVEAHPSVYPEKFHNVFQHHPNHLCVFTDGSRDNYRAACTASLKKKC